VKVAVNIISAKKIYAKQKIDDLNEKSIVPKMMMRRRLTRNAKIMLYLADSCGFRNGKIIYGSAFGELGATVGITDAILNKTPISPTLFQNSVYNSAPSYFSLLNSDKDEIITLSNGMKTSKDVLKCAALQSLISGESIFCVVTESLDIDRIDEVNNCAHYLEAGAGVILQIAENENGAKELQSSIDEGVIASLDDLISLVNMYEEDKELKLFIEL